MINYNLSFIDEVKRMVNIDFTRHIINKRAWENSQAFLFHRQTNHGIHELTFIR